MAVAEDFNTNLLRLLVSELYFLIGMQISREMFGKSYFALSALEKTSVDQMTMGMVGGNFQTLTPEMFRQPATPGFQAPPGPTKS